MASFKLIYTKASGLTQTKLLEAYCYAFVDSFIHFYKDEEHYTKCKPFKSINQSMVTLVAEEESTQV